MKINNHWKNEKKKKKKNTQNQKTNFQKSF